ncbi:MAG: hypothetical protein LUI07_07565 [Lachnospiraceae bacterium]|nr:hypothetical protein [Lachnospiraceae bacterium]
MKRKYIILCMGLTVALALTGCGSSDSSSNSSNETDAAVSDTATESAPSEDTGDSASSDISEDNDSASSDISEDDDSSSSDTSEDGDSSSSDISEDDASASSDTSESDDSASSDSDEEAASSLAPITPSDYLAENAGDYVTAGSLEGLEATQYTYEITDETVQEEIEADLSMMSEETDVDRAAQSGDVIYVDLTSTVEGTEETYTENTYFYLGDAEYGEEFDEALIGASSGESLTFSITFDEDAADYSLIDEAWAGQTVQFEAEIEAVCEITEAEYNDDFVAENTDYATTEEYEAALKEALEAEYEELSYMDVLEALLEAALESCEFSEIPEDLYESCREETLNSYGAFLGTTDEEEILAEFDMTEEDLELEVQELAERRLLISYICEENDVEITEEDYVSYVEEYAEYYGYETASDFEDDMERSYLVWSLYESAAAQILYSSADITTEAYSENILTDEEIEELEEMEEETADEAEAESQTEVPEEVVEESEMDTASVF